MKILLIGATGQVGYALVQALAKSGHQITVLIRAVGRLGFPEGVSVVVESTFTGATFERLLPEVDCAIYGVGLPEQFAFDTGIFENVNLKLLKTFLAAMAKSGLRRLVYISTYEVFAAQNGVIRETHPTSDPDGLTPYFSAMTKAYLEVTAFAKRMAITTIHPAALYGGLNTGDGFTNVIENLLNWRVWKLPVILPGRFPLVHAESLAKAIVLSLEHEGAFIVSDGMYSLKELAHTLRRQVRSYVPPEVPAGFPLGVEASGAPSVWTSFFSDALSIAPATVQPKNRKNFRSYPSHSTTRRHARAEFGAVSGVFDGIENGYTQPIDAYRDFAAKSRC